MENKKLYCELHSHSVRSDGELSREEVIQLAIEHDIGALAITDHNIEFDDIDELQMKFREIRLINGAEISTGYLVPDTGKLMEIHVIALDFDNTEHFSGVLWRNRFDSRDYVNKIIEKLRESGLDISFTYDDLKKELRQEFIGRMAVARKLVSLGICPDVDKVFDEYIGDFGRRKAYVEPEVTKYLPINTAVREIRKAGGIPILCHPYSHNLSEDQVVRLIEDFKAYGGLAMETLYSQYSEEQEKKLIAYAEKYDLLPSAASDFHGRGKKNSLDHRFPISYAENLLAIGKDVRRTLA